MIADRAEQETCAEVQWSPAHWRTVPFTAQFNDNYAASVHLTCKGRITPLGYSLFPSLSNEPR